jgi:hypothetical protein
MTTMRVVFSLPRQRTGEQVLTSKDWSGLQPSLTSIQGMEGSCHLLGARQRARKRLPPPGVRLLRHGKEPGILASRPMATVRFGRAGRRSGW